MLVVIAIMFILLGLLGPAFAHARGTAALTKCLNSKKNLSAAMMMYANEHDGVFIYKGPDYTYADVMNGLYIGNGTGAKQLTKEYMPEKELRCSLAKTDKLDDNAENAVGMLNALEISSRTSSGITVSTSCWLESNSKYDSSKKNYELHGRFAKVVQTNSKGDTTNKDTVIYILDRMKAPGELVIFADTFKTTSSGAREGEDYWSFIPDKEDNNAMITLIHKHTAAAAFADGHAAGQTRGELRDGKTGVVKFAGEEFKKDDFSD